MHYKCSIKKVGMALSWILPVGFVICMLWVFTNSDPELRKLHLDLLRITFVWFDGMDLMSWISGLVQSYVWGWIAAVIIVPLWNAAHAKKEVTKKMPMEEKPMEEKKEE